jgi:hypothetical protein
MALCALLSPVSLSVCLSAVRFHLGGQVGEDQGANPFFQFGTGFSLWGQVLVLDPR